MIDDVLAPSRWIAEASERASTGQRCRCGHHFRVPNGEGGEHACPRCGAGDPVAKPAECTVCGGSLPDGLREASDLLEPCICDPEPEE